MTSPSLTSLLVRWEQAYAQGQDLSAEQLCPDHPRLAAELERCLGGLRRMRAVLTEIEGETLSPADSSRGAPSTVPPTPGQTPTSAGGSISPPGYEVLGELGRGGMGVVYRARHVGLNRLVALKMILSGGHAGQEERARFLAEAKAIAAVKHPGIVQVHDFGTHEGLPFFSLEFCEGGSLAGKLAGTPLPPREAAQLVARIAQAIQAAHERGIVHRDLKPANVLLAEDGSPKVTDFGLAKRVEADAGMTATGAVMGTPSYMAPEQAQGKKEVSRAADVYALGAILYECLTGRPPFRAATTYDTLLQVVGTEPVSPRQLNPRVPRDLETVCLKCLRKEPQKRYASAAALADDLDRFLAGEPVLAQSLGILARAVKWARRRPTAAALVGVSVLALVVLASGAVAFTAELADRNRLLTREVERAEEAEEDARQEAQEAERQKQKAQKLATREARARRVVAEERDRAQHQARRAEGARHCFQLDLARRAWEQDDVIEAERLLADVDASLTDTWEQRYLLGLCRRKALPLLGHAGSVTSVAISGNGKRAFSGGEDGTVRAWDAVAGREPFNLKGHQGPVFAVALSADGLHAVSGGKDRTVRVWDALTGKERLRLSHPAAVAGVAVSAAGERIVTAGVDRRVRVWDGASGKELHTLTGHTAEVVAVAVSGDGKRAVSASFDKSVKVWDLEAGKQERTLKGHQGEVHGVGLSRDGKRVASGGMDGMVMVWEADTGKRQHALKSPGGEIAGVVLSGDGKRVVVASARAVFVWDGDTGRGLTALQGHTDWLHAVAVSSDGQRVVSAGDDGTVTIWDAVTRSESETITFNSMTRAVAAGGKRVAVRSGGMVRLLEDGVERFAADTGDWGAVNLAVSATGQRVVFGQASAVKVWDADAGKEKFSLSGHNDKVTSVGITADGRRLISGSADNTAKVWDGQTGRLLLTLSHAHPVLGVGIQDDGKRVVTGGQHGVKVWDVETGQVTAAFPFPGGVSRLGTSADGRLVVAAGWDRTLTAWDLSSNAVRFTARCKDINPVLSLAVSRDGKRIVCGTGTVSVWDAEAGLEKLALKGQSSFVLGVAISGDGKRILSTDGSDVKVWEAPDNPANRISRRFESRQVRVVNLAPGAIPAPSRLRRHPLHTMMRHDRLPAD